MQAGTIQWGVLAQEELSQAKILQVRQEEGSSLVAARAKAVLQITGIFFCDIILKFNHKEVPLKFSVEGHPILADDS